MALLAAALFGVALEAVLEVGTVALVVLALVQAARVVQTTTQLAAAGPVDVTAETLVQTAPPRCQVAAQAVAAAADQVPELFLLLATEASLRVAVVVAAPYTPAPIVLAKAAAAAQDKYGFILGEVKMKRYAIVNPDGVVENMIIWDEVSQWTPPEGHTMVKAEEVLCDIGWKYENGAFVRPPEDVEQPAA